MKYSYSLMDAGKKEFAVLMVLGVLMAASFSLAADSILDSDSDSFVAQYRFDEGAGNTAYDYSNNSFDGSIDGAKWTDGIQGKALSFDGEDDVVDLSNNPEFQPSVFTYSVWIKPSKISTSNNDHYIYSKESGGPWNKINMRKGGIRATLTTGQNTVNVDAGVSENLLQTDEWHHVVFTYNGSAATVFVDGVKKGQKSISGGPIYTTQQPLIGYSSDEGPQTRHFPGKIDDFRIYSEALNLSEVKSLYNFGSSFSVGQEGRGLQGKVLDISFDKWNSTHIFDTSGNNNHGSPENDVSQKDAVHCKVGRCYSFDGDNDFIEIPDNPDFDWGDNLTVMGWAYVDSWGQDGAIVGKKRGSGSEPLLWSDSGNDNFAWAVNTGEGFCKVDATPVTRESGRWYHVTGVYNGSRAKLYVDGRLEGQDTDACGGGVSTSSSDLFIGRSQGGSKFFQGRIDQVKVFDRELSQNEVIQEAEGLSSNGAVLDLRFEESGGETVYDSSVYENNGVLNPDEETGPTRSDGIRGNALSFDGEDDFVKTPSFSGASGEEVSYSYWAYFPEKTQESHAKVLQAGGSPTNLPDAGVTHENNPSSRGNNQLGIFHWSGGYNEVGRVEVNTGQWNHIVHVAEGDNGTVYVNGEKRIEAAVAQRDISENPVILGKSDNAWQGKMDSVKIFPYSLSSEKAKQLYSQGSSIIKEQSSSKTGLEDGLIGYWSFNEGNRTHTFDSSGYVNHGRLTGTTELNAASCRLGSCRSFDGEEGEATVSQDSSFDFNSSITISTWLRTDQQNAADGGGQGIIDTQKQNDKGYRLTVENGVAEFGIYADRIGGGLRELNGGVSISDGEWHHVVGTWNSSSGNMEIYIDGKLDTTGSQNQMAKPERDLYIGMRDDGDGYFNGSLDQLRLYNQSLTRSEIWSLYSKGRDQIGNNEMAGPLAWWRMDEGQGQKVHDYSGEENDGVRGSDSSSSSDNPSWVGSCKRNGCLSFDGDDQVSWNGQGDVRDSFSVTSWVYPTTIDSNNQLLFWGDGPPQIEFFYDENDGNDITFIYFDGDENGFGSSYDTFGLETNRWQHLTGTYNDSSGTWRLYLDGQLMNETVQEVDTDFSGSVNRIGEHPSNAGRNWNGRLDDVRIYPYALNQDQVKEVMNGGAAQIG